MLQAAGKRQAPPAGADGAEELHTVGTRGADEDVSRSFSGFLSAAEWAGVAPAFSTNPNPKPSPE